MKTIIFFVLVLVNIVAFAQTENQIIYRDFEPDTCATTPYYPIVLPAETKDTILIDINEDSIDDLMIYFAGAQPHMQAPYIRCLGQNTYMCIASDDTLNNDSLNWYYGGSPFFPTNGNNYGFRQFDGQNYYYGWFSIYYSYYKTDLYFCIDKMAFCTIPNYPLLWGQTEIENSVPKTESDGAMLYLNYRNGDSKLDISSECEILAVEITASNGQQVKKQSVTRANQTEIDVSNLPAGVYVVKATLIDKRVVCAKFVK
jgi:hypothetical protein